MAGVEGAEVTAVKFAVQEGEEYVAALAMGVKTVKKGSNRGKGDGKPKSDLIVRYKATLEAARVEEPRSRREFVRYGDS